MESTYILTSNGRLYYRDTNEFYHAGVKGMKWGVRRAKKKDGTSRKRPFRDLQDPKRLKARVEAHGAGWATVGSVARGVGRGVGKTALAYLTFGLAAGELQKRGHARASDAVSAIGDIALGGALIVDAVKTGKEIVDIQMYKRGVKK